MGAKARFVRFGATIRVVIAGLDPAIHLLRIKGFMRWTPGSSPGVTNAGMRERIKLTGKRSRQQTEDSEQVATGFLPGLDPGMARE